MSSTLIVIKLNGVRLKTQVDSLSLSDTTNEFGSNSETFHSSNTGANDLSGPAEIRPNRQLQKFVEYVSYLKFLVTFVVSDVSVTVDTRDEQDLITAASFEASGWLCMQLSNYYVLQDITNRELNFPT